MSQPRATLLAPMRLDAYIRVSQVRGRSGPSFISPTQQRDRIEAWIAAFGHERGEVFEELDASGARADRPKLQAAIEPSSAGSPTASSSPSSTASDDRSWTGCS